MGILSPQASVSAPWGPKALNNVVDVDLRFEVEKEQGMLRRLQRCVEIFVYLCKRLIPFSQDTEPITVQVKGSISKFAVGDGQTATSRQFLVDHVIWARFDGFFLISLWQISKFLLVGVI